MGYLVEVKNLTKEFPLPLSLRRLSRLDFSPAKPVRALDNLSFRIEKGSIVGVLGANGAGKTTLLKILATLIIPDGGTVEVSGLRVGSEDKKIRRLIGLAGSADRSFYERLTGRQNLEFFGALYGMDRREMLPRINELCALFATDSPDKPFYSYSSGTKQKFGLIRAFLHDPGLLLFDEPAKSLDYLSALSLLDFLKNSQVRKQGKTVIFTTHVIQETEGFADLIIILQKGRLLAAGSLEDLRRGTAMPAAKLSDIYLELTRRNDA